MIFALTALPLLGVVGGAVDFGMAVSNKSTLQDAADAAALAGARAASNYISTNGTTAPQIALAIALGNSTAQTMFSANIAAIGGGPAGGLSTPSVTVNTTVSSSAPTVVVTASSTYTPFLLSVAGVKSIPLNVTSTTTMAPSNSYYQIVFVVDVSGSMGIGADSATISTMQNSPAFNDVNNLPCAFACHDTTNWEGVKATNWCNASPQDYFCLTNGPYYCPYGSGNCLIVPSTTWSDKRNIARIAKYKLKIDYVNSAISDFMTQLSSYNSKYPGRFTVSIDLFGSNTNGNGVKFFQMQQPTTNMATATSAANTIDLEPNVYPVGAGGYTYTTSGLTSALSSITNMGDGSAPTKMLTYVVFLSDGVEDVYSAGSFTGRQTGTAYTSACTAMKNAGVNIFSIWSTYPAIPNDPTRYDVLVKPIASQVPTAMQNCASNTNQYFQADDGNAITAAVNSTFNTIVANSKLRITN